MKMSILGRLNDKTTIDPITKCWLWYGAKDEMGYGRIRVTSIHPNKTYIHRLSAHLHFKFDLNSEKLILHKLECPNKNCWNPEHLYIGDQSKNMVDRVAIKGIWGGHESGAQHKTVCNKGHKMTDENTYKYNKGGYTAHACRTCRIESARKSRQKQTTKTN